WRPRTRSAGGARPKAAIASARGTPIPVGAAGQLPASYAAPSATITRPAPPLQAPASVSQAVDSAPLPVGAAWLLPAPPAGPTAAPSKAPRPPPAWPFYSDNAPRHLGLRFFPCRHLRPPPP